MAEPRPFLILISGPTGTGKSEIAAVLAAAIDGDVINADSIQIYRGLDIGSAKPGSRLMQMVPHHLYDSLDPDEHLDVAGWVDLAERVIAECAKNGRQPIIAGGTNFYLRALLRGLPELPARQPNLRRRLDAILQRPSGSRHLHRLLRGVDPVSAARIERSDRHRIERALEVFAASGRPISSFEAPSPDTPPRYPHIQFALNLDRDVLRDRLERRVRTMFESGLIEETRELLMKYPRDLRPLGSIGYREAVALLEGTIDKDEAISIAVRRTKAYARRQMTWLRAEQDVHWLDASDTTESIVRTMIEIVHEHRKESGFDKARRDTI